MDGPALPCHQQLARHIARREDLVVSVVGHPEFRQLQGDRCCRSWGVRDQHDDPALPTVGPARIDSRWKRRDAVVQHAPDIAQPCDGRGLQILDARDDRDEWRGSGHRRCVSAPQPRFNQVSTLVHPWHNPGVTPRRSGSRPWAGSRRTVEPTVPRKSHHVPKARDDCPLQRWRPRP